jgi:hypothetical protein
MAVQFRRNILAHGTFPSAPYFLMVFPDKFYLWVNVDAHSDQSDLLIQLMPVLFLGLILNGQG